MNSKKVLIITHTKDNASVLKVCQYIQQMGGTVIRFNVDQYPLASTVTSQYRDGSWEIILDNGNRYRLNDLTSVWYRRSHHIGHGMEDLLSPTYLPASRGEMKRTFYGMMEALPCFQMEKYSTYRRLDSKEEQLRLAANCGLEIPATCISNSPARVKEFIREVGGTVITKMQSSFSITQGGDEQVVFTNELTSADLNDLDSLAYCPMMFQQKLEKKLELRVTIVGDKIFAFSIDSQKEINAQVDWRKEGLALIDDWQSHTLPSSIQSQLMTLMDCYQLHYGAIDLILTPDDTYYFLELNPAGEYFWLDKLCDFEISQQIARVLLGDAKTRLVEFGIS